MRTRWREQRIATVTTASSTPAPRVSTGGWGAVCTSVNLKTRVQLRMDGTEPRSLLISEWQSYFRHFSTLNIKLFRGETKISINEYALFYVLVLSTNISMNDIWYYYNYYRQPERIPRMWLWTLRRCPGWYKTGSVWPNQRRRPTVIISVLQLARWGALVALWKPLFDAVQCNDNQYN